MLFQSKFMTKDPLYQDDKLKIGYLLDSIEDHLLYIGEEIELIIPRGILRELGKTPRGEIGSKIQNFNPNISFYLREQGIEINGLHVALCQAYAKEEEMINDFVKEGLREKISELEETIELLDS